MTPAEYRTAIAALGLSQVKAAKALGVDTRTSHRWAAGESKVPKAVELLLKAMLKQPWIAALKQPRAKRKSDSHGQDDGRPKEKGDSSKAPLEVVQEPILTENERRELWIRQHPTGETR